MQTNQNKIQLEEVIKLWKEEGYTSASYEFSCGGDSMGDTQWYFYGKNGKVVSQPNQTIVDYLDEEVYKRVEFYECSDGHYQGEAGNVEVICGDDDFDFLKSSTSEWSEQFSGTMEIELTEEEESFLRDYIKDFNGGDSEDNVNYSKDFILTEKQEEIITSIKERIRDEANNFQPEDAQGEEREWYTYSANVEEMRGNTLMVEVNKEYTIFKDGD